MKTSLKEIAEALNEVLGLSPAIKTVGVKKEALKAKIEEAAALISPDDEFEADIKADLEEMELWPAPAGKKKAGKGKTKPAPEPDPEEEEDEEEEAEEEEEEEEVKKPAKKAKAKPEPEEEEEEDDEEEEEEEDDEEEEKPKKGAVKKAPAKAKSKEKGESMQDIADRLLKEKATPKEITAAFTAAYKAKKGISDKDYVAKRIAIYMKIAAEKVPAKKK